MTRDGRRYISAVKNRHGVSPLTLARTIVNFDVAQYFADLF